MKTALLCAVACLWTLPAYAQTPLYTYVNPMVGGE